MSSDHRLCGGEAVAVDVEMRRRWLVGGVLFVLSELRIRNGMGYFCFARQEFMLSFRVRMELEIDSFLGLWIGSEFGWEGVLLFLLVGVMSRKVIGGMWVISGWRGGGVTSLITGKRLYPRVRVADGLVADGGEIGINGCPFDSW